MTYRIAINGYGRIGRQLLRALYEYQQHGSIKVVAINDLTDASTSAHLTKYDTTHGRFHADIQYQTNKLVINGDSIDIFSEKNPANLPWKKLDIDLVMECSGHFKTKEKASLHLAAGAKKVLISAPGDENMDMTVVYGINHDQLLPEHTIVSNASCTTNCLAPLVKPLHDEFTINAGLMTTIHAYTNDQVLTDVAHNDLRRARSATQSMIPTSTGAAKALGLVIPELTGKITGYSMRVPTINVSVVDLSFTTVKPVTKERINQVMLEASKGQLKHILDYNDEPLVSIDFNHNPASAIFDATQTEVVDNLVKVLAWYDNEWGFANRMLDVASMWLSKN